MPFVKKRLDSDDDSFTAGPTPKIPDSPPRKKTRGNQYQPPPEYTFGSSPAGQNDEGRAMGHWQTQEGDSAPRYTTPHHTSAIPFHDVASPFGLTRPSAASRESISPIASNPFFAHSDATVTTGFHLSPPSRPLHIPLRPSMSSPYTPHINPSYPSVDVDIPVAISPPELSVLSPLPASSPFSDIDWHDGEFDVDNYDTRMSPGPFVDDVSEFTVMLNSPPNSGMSAPSRGSTDPPEGASLPDVSEVTPQHIPRPSSTSWPSEFHYFQPGVSPEKGRGTAGGRPRNVNIDRERNRREAEERERERLKAEAARKQQESVRARQLQEVQDVQDLFNWACAPKEEGGWGFRNLAHIFSAITLPGLDPQFSANLSRWVRDDGQKFIEHMFQRSPELDDIIFDAQCVKRLEKEGRAIQAFFTREWFDSDRDLLHGFSMENIGDELEHNLAPTLFGLLSTVSTGSNGSAEKRNRSLVLTCICAMISILRSQKANEFQTVIGLFLLGSGAAKREIAVFAHAGLSISYSSVLHHVRDLSAATTKHYLQVVKECMVELVWDNINIAHRVAEQRLANKNHFDNGTTATLVVLYGDENNERLPHGYLPLALKPVRQSSKNLFDWTVEDTLPTPQAASQLSTSCLWMLRQLAITHIDGLKRLESELEACPVVDQIPVHKTEHYALPALHKDESTIDGTIDVHDTLYRHLEFTDESLEAHGLNFDHGDLLTHLIKEMIEAARMNSTTPIEGRRASLRIWGLFHAKMAGGRMVVNEHWGKPNSPWAGGLWWENTKILKRRPMQAGWKGKKATPWKDAHELLKISLPAHIVDGFRLYCGHEELSLWAERASMDEFNRVATKVFDNLFSSAKVEELRRLPEEERDHTLENSILYNRDALFYMEYVSSIKRGDIGRVVNVLSIWMVMMRTVATMPKYADAIFEMLGRLRNYDPKLRHVILHNWLVNIRGIFDGFKEVDLLQEHQNFWIKIIYAAKGTNKSWRWLSMVSVCVWTLRDAMRTVQLGFNIPAYGVHHSSPSIIDEIKALAKALADECIQSYVLNRRGNNDIAPVRDLIVEGAKYTNKPNAFEKFTEDPRRARNVGLVVPEDADSDDEPGMGDESEEEEDNSLGGPDGDVTLDDLTLDEEEDYTRATSILARATTMADDMLTGLD